MKILLYLFIYIALSNLLFADTKDSNATLNRLEDKAEQEIISIISLISQQKTDLALKKAEQLHKSAPNFHLGQLIHSDLLLNRSNTLNNFFVFEKDNLKKDNYLAELGARVDSVNLQKMTNQSTPDNFDFFSADIAYILAFDYTKSRLYLFQNKASDQQTVSLKLIADQYLSIGQQGALKQIEGDKKSPIGVYRITAFIEDNNLPELYGWGAFPINYPNRWDKKLSRTGSGIWLHGVPRSQYSRPPQSSRGCLVVSNNFLQELSRYIGINTPMLLAKSINWTKSGDKKDSQLINYLKLWHNSWLRKDLTTFSKLYAPEFFKGEEHKKQWLTNKSKLLSSITASKIIFNLSQISIMHYPNEANLVSVNFQVEYQYNNHSQAVKNQQYWTQQYWQKNNYGLWQIIDEEIEK
ncbi:MAG: L,D-transpeptidase family protein [Gammaproteobacteria bacterium]|nr:L,D-transpeptidase family protein [Gammaproteobacteria bacterium]